MPNSFSSANEPSVEIASDVTVELFQSNALEAAARCVLVAESEAAGAEYRFWLEVFKRLAMQSAARTSDTQKE